jgi:hypothetical protein
MSYIWKYNKSMSHGYHWCDNCDENTFAAATCPTCQQPARFIPLPQELPTRQLSPQQPVPKIPAAEWFRRMREVVQNTKPT